VSVEETFPTPRNIRLMLLNSVGEILKYGAEDHAAKQREGADLERVQVCWKVMQGEGMRLTTQEIYSMWKQQRGNP
jgi:hypothetical protein